MLAYSAAACDRTVSDCDGLSVKVGPRHVDGDPHDVIKTSAFDVGVGYSEKEGSCKHAPVASHVPAHDSLAQQRPARHDPEAHREDAEHDAPDVRSAHAPVESHVLAQPSLAQQRPPRHDFEAHRVDAEHEAPEGRLPAFASNTTAPVPWVETRMTLAVQVEI